MFRKLLHFSFIVLAFAGAAVAQNSSVMAQAQRVTGDRFTVAATTPRGANIFAVKTPSEAMLKAIDQGLSDLFNVARKHGYRKRLDYSDYNIYIANADRTRNGSAYSPDIAVGAAQYRGTEYDNGGYIFAAGMVIARNPMAFVVAEHTSDFSRVSNVVRFEGEHLVLYYNDPQRYRATADHSRGGGHPILQ
jgi:hypothetical protein